MGERRVKGHFHVPWQATMNSIGIMRFRNGTFLRCLDDVAMLPGPARTRPHQTVKDTSR